MTRGRFAKIAFLLAGLGVVAFLRTRGPHEQHVNFVLGDAAGDVTSLDLQYVDAEGEVAREARLAFLTGQAPRVVSHEAQLPDGPYKLRLDIHTRDRRVPVERSVTLSGGSTQIDLSAALAREKR